MTPEQATDIREHLIKQLNDNGFGDVVSEVYTRLREDYEEKGFERNPQYLTEFFLTESMNVLRGLSNKSYDNLLSRLNKYVSEGNRIESISVELLNDGQQRAYDLKQLPNYAEIIDTLNTILEQIKNDN